MHRVIFFLGIGLLILSGGSAVALFLKAIGSKDSSREQLGRGTLWGLFTVGLLMGLFLLLASTGIFGI